jgi:hypothetical protein
MKVARISRRFDRRQIQREIEAELQFHLDLLTQENRQQEMSPADARAAALKRFGDVQKIADQCVEISSRRNPLTRALKILLIPTFLVGVLVRWLSSEPNIAHVGETLIFCAVLGRLFFYVRALNPLSFRRQPQRPSPLRLNDDGAPPNASGQQ